MAPVLLNPSRFASSGGAAAYWAAVLALSPWACYKTDETSGTTLADASGNGRSMTLNGSPNLAQTGPGGSPISDALGFTTATNQYGVTTATNNSGPLTYAVWVKLPANPTVVNGILARSVGFLSSGASDAELSIGTDGKVTWSVFDNVATRTLTSTAALSLNTWHLIVPSVGAAGMNLRIDKADAATPNTSVTTAYTGAAMNVFLRGGGSRMSGHDAIQIARPAIWNSQLSSANSDGLYDAA